MMYFDDISRTFDSGQKKKVALSKMLTYEYFNRFYLIILSIYLYNKLKNKIILFFLQVPIFY